MPQINTRKFPQWLRSEFKPDILLPNLSSGVIMGVTEVIFAISLGSLIFSGELTAFISRGIGIALFTAAVMMVVTSLGSKVPGVIGSTQDTSSVILAVIAAGLVGTLSGSDAETRLMTVLVAIATATLLTGVFFVALGYFRLGGLVRYIPYPVIGGFLAGTGWLLLQGSFSVMANFPLKLATINNLFQADQMILWVPGVIFAVILFFGVRRFKHVLVLPGILIGAVILFYIVIWVMGISVGEATQKGLLLGQLSGGVTWKPLLPAYLLSANWTAILGQGGNISIILILSLVGLLLNASALELAIRGDIDLNRELRAAGVANMISGLGGGIVGYHALSLSMLSYRIGGRGRLPGLVAGAVCLAMLVAGTAMLALFPKPILGGLLFFLGLDFLVEWLVAGWKKLSHTDYGVVLLILVAIAATDFLIGVAVGLIATIILFVLNYSRIDVVYHAFSGAEVHSNVERCTYHRRALVDLGQRIYILELQGFIFFGTANTLVERIRARIADTQQPKVRYIIMDFRRVSALDSSAGLSFNKGKQLAEAQGVTLVLTNMSEKIQRQLSLSDLPEKGVSIFPDLDRGLEWCEEQLLEVNQITGLYTPVALVGQLAVSGFEKTSTTRLKEFLERVVFKEGDYLIYQGDEAVTLFFIEMGSVSVYLQTDSGERVRLQTYGMGTAVGEMDLYQGVKCTASVMADSPVIAYRLTRGGLSLMKEKDPSLAATFHEFIAHLLSERLAATTRTLEAVIR
jgi:SulP family sulfate permease